jgi:hypothetical protein
MRRKFGNINKPVSNFPREVIICKLCCEIEPKIKYFVSKALQLSKEMIIFASFESPTIPILLKDNIGFNGI